MKKYLIFFMIFLCLLTVSSCAEATHEAKETTAHQTTTEKTTTAQTTKKENPAITTTKQKPTPEKKSMTLDDIKALVEAEKELTWSDFTKYKSEGDVGSGLYILYYHVGDYFCLLVGGGGPINDEPPLYAYLALKADTSIRVDILEVDSFAELFSRFPILVSAEDKVALSTLENPSTCLLEEDAALICEIINGSEWVPLDEVDTDSYDIYYFDFVPFYIVYYPHLKLIFNYDHDLALYLSDEDAVRIDAMLEKYYSKTMTLDDIRAFREKGSVTWADLALFDGENTATGWAGAKYIVEEDYVFSVRGRHDPCIEEPLSVTALYSPADGRRIDIFDEDFEKFLTGDFSVSRALGYQAVGKMYLTRTINDEEYSSVLLEDDAKALCELFREAAWFIGSGVAYKDCDYYFQIDKYYFNYDEETGTLNDSGNARTTTLSDAARKKLNEILAGCCVRKMTFADLCDLVRMPERFTWQDLAPFLGENKILEIIYPINESYYVKVNGDFDEEIESAYLYYGAYGEKGLKTNLFSIRNIDLFISTYENKH